MVKKIHIGTSGWHYKHWRSRFYPRELKSQEWLKFYAQKFSTAEINNSFYQLPKPQTFKQWQREVGKDFKFSIKASRYITHMKKLKSPKQSAGKFFSRVKGLGENAGPILFQLPPRWKSNLERLEDFLKYLPKKYKYTFEFREKSWLNKEVYAILKKYNVAFCIYELAGYISPLEVTSDFIYIRLHGSGNKSYEGCYHKNTLKKWARRFKKWRKAGKEIFCYFDNDQNAYAPKNALELKQILSLQNKQRLKCKPN